jgi:superfamily II RNA helicase
VTRDELERALSDLPFRLLRRLARTTAGPQVMRMGKRRLIQTIMAEAEASPERVEAAIRAHQAEQQAVGAIPPSPAEARPESPHAGKPADLGAFLEGIGVPEPRPFVPDDWQLEALDALTRGDVIVSVPTGSGKTYVAVEATRRAMHEDRTVVYTSPLKALSNTKFTEFTKIFGAEFVGIITGDRRDNPQAPILIMTTEILRNLLYDAAGGEIDVRLDTLGLVILDESQFLADPERGVVWEETIIFCPSQARLLLLSASIGNPQELAAWLTSIRQDPCHLVRHQRRSVPLRAGYLHPSGKLTPLFRTVAMPPSPAQAVLHPEAKRLFTMYEEDTLHVRRSG